MVGTRTSSLEVQIDEATRNWVTNHVESVIGPLNERFEGIAASLAQLLVQHQYANRVDGNSRFTRLGKMEFPKFHGEDVKGWIFRVKQYFAIDAVGEGDKIKLVSIHLYERALTCHLQFIKNHGEAVTWAEYEEAVLKRFGDANEDPMAELKNLRLPATIEINVRMFKPRSLEDAFSLSSINVTYPTKNTITLALPAPITQTVTKSNVVSGSRPRNMLSQKEYDEKRNKKGKGEVFENCLEEESSGMTDPDSGMGENMELRSLLEEYADVFEEPKTLPPHRSFNHQILLKDGDMNVNVSPYRYPPAQKDVIETMVNELLDSGVIRPSHSVSLKILSRTRKLRFVLACDLSRTAFCLFEDHLLRFAKDKLCQNQNCVACCLRRLRFVFKKILRFVFKKILRFASEALRFA
nr:hypothetical protein [Tanacetum cinerariifolium]